MKHLLTITPLIAALLAPASVLALPSAGNIGSVTLALTLTLDEGGFKDANGNPTTEKTVSSATTEAVHSKRVIRKAKYSNKEFLADLIAKGTLSGPVSSWSIKFVDSVDENFQGFFALNTSGAVVYLGGEISGESEAFSLTRKNGSATSAEGRATDAYYSRDKSQGNLKSTTLEESWRATNTIAVTLRPTIEADDNLTAVGLYHTRGTFSLKSFTADSSQSYTYRLFASSLADLVGDNEQPDDSPILQGSIRISALKETADIGAYVAAYPYLAD